MDVCNLRVNGQRSDLEAFHRALCLLVPIDDDGGQAMTVACVRRRRPLVNAVAELAGVQVEEVAAV